MEKFESSLDDLVSKANPKSINEIGCGEGYWVIRWQDQGLEARGCDFSKQVIEIAQKNAATRNLPTAIFNSKSIYDLDSNLDSADLIVCCEVLEHLENPAAGLQALQKVVTKHLIISVPQEPLWCFLNFVRGKYIRTWGNTPGHLQHWSRAGFVKFVSQYFDVIEVRSPLPWTMLLCSPRNT